MLTINKMSLDKSFVFSGGEVQIRLPMESMELITDQTMICVETVLDSSNAIQELRLVKDALDHYFANNPIKLIIHYLPYARQDRRCFRGEAWGSEVMVTDLVNMNFDTVEVMDVHSEQRLPSNFHEIKLLDVFKLHFGIMEGITAVVAPDKGAAEKVRTIAEHFEVDWIIANKVRNPDTGFIGGMEIIEGAEYVTDTARLLVIDDICDGGMTFDILGDELTSIAPFMKVLNLYVTHGIFSKGLSNLDFYDNIYTTNSICKLQDPKLTVLSV